MRNYFIGIAGNIGVGKTTFTRKISNHFGWEEIYESVLDNPYLDDFYKDMSRWSFNLQVYFLQHRISAHIELMKNNKNVVQDRTIYEDLEIFAKNLYKMNYMTKKDWMTFNSLFVQIEKFLRKPDLIIYLRGSTDTLLSRIKKRNRDFEKDINPEYLYSLNTLYEKWIKNNKFKTLTIETDRFNIFKDHNKLKNIFNEIEKKLSI